MPLAHVQRPHRYQSGATWLLLVSRKENTAEKKTPRRLDK
jgi:hypothetical protein